MSPFLLVLSAHGLMVSSSYLRHAWLPTVAPVRENAAVTSDRTAAVRELFKRGGSPSAVQPALDPKSMFEQRRAQIEKINNDANALFNILDRNGDDVISREELGAHLLLARYTEEHVTKIFSVIDTNADGVISRNELRIAFERYPPIRVAPAMGLLPKRQRNALHAEADATFDQLDVNGGSSAHSTTPPYSLVRALPAESTRASTRGSSHPHARPTRTSRL